MTDKNIGEEIKQNDFFNLCGEELKNIALNSRNEQDRIRQVAKIAVLRKKDEGNIEGRLQGKQKKLLDNVIIDYLRTLNLNYSYTIVMRERNLTSQEVASKQKTIDLLGLNEIYNRIEGFDVSVLQLLMMQLAQWKGQQKEKRDSGIQVELVSSDGTTNNQVLMELRVSEARRLVEESERRHYTQMLESMKQQLRVTLTDEIRHENQTKMRTMKQLYQKQVQELRQKSKEVLMNHPKMNSKVEQYLNKIQKLESINFQITQKHQEAQKYKITHNCLHHEDVIQKEKDLRKERGLLQKKRKEYDLALGSIQTSVEDLVTKKAKIHQESNPTDRFLAERKTNKASKDHMIDQIYGRMFVMDKRVQTLASDNQHLLQENRQLLSKIKQQQTEKRGLVERQQQSERAVRENMKQKVKPRSKEAIVGVNQDDLREIQEPKREHAIDELSQESDDEESIRNRQRYRLEVQGITSEMKLLKNKLRFMVEDFS